MAVDPGCDYRSRLRKNFNRASQPPPVVVAARPVRLLVRTITVVIGAGAYWLLRRFRKIS